MAGRRQKSRLVAIGLFGRGLGRQQLRLDHPALGDLRLQLGRAFDHPAFQHIGRFVQRIAVAYPVGDVVKAERHAARRQRGRTNDEMPRPHQALRLDFLPRAIAPGQTIDPIYPHMVPAMGQ